jgi:hypothetical protein
MSDQVDLSILDKPYRDVQSYINEQTDVSVVSALGRAELSGKRRSTVLDAIQQRVGAIVDGGPTVPAELQNEVREDLFDVLPDAGQDTAITGGAIETNREPNIAMWFKDPLGPYMPRIVAAGTHQDCIKGGALDHCPDCLRKNCGVSFDQRRNRLQLTGNPNDCPARTTKLAFARCPVCAKPMFDPGASDPNETLGEGEIRLNFSTTPDQRVLAQVRVHMLAFHAGEAPRYGVIATTAEATMLNPPPLPGEATPTPALPATPVAQQ